MNFFLIEKEGKAFGTEATAWTEQPWSMRFLMVTCWGEG